MSKIQELCKKHEEIIVYLIVGVLTTIVSFAACAVAKIFLDPKISFENFLIQTIGWVAGVCFAYPLNRVWVFKSKNKHIVKEFGGFAVSRLSTWILDALIMELFINIISFKESFIGLLARFDLVISDPNTQSDVYWWFVKIFISAVLVTILNYVFSKCFIFNKKKKADGKIVQVEAEQ